MQEKRKCAIDLDHGELPDPVADVITLLLKRQDEMESQIKDLGITSTVIEANGLLTRKNEIKDISRKVREFKVIIQPQNSHYNKKSTLIPSKLIPPTQHLKHYI